jgi:tetratricopeptide (TPR) repeat protein
LANEHPGTVAGTLARFESATPMDELGRSEQTTALWQEALGEAAGNPRLEGMLQQRIAAAHENADAWSQAATAHEAAAAIADYPLRYWAMVDAGRCWLAAGEPERALGFFDQVETEAPDLRLPDHIKVVVQELREASDAADLAPPDGSHPAAGGAPEAAAGEAAPQDSPPTPPG